MNFCTYIHYLPDGTPFYVGKGTAVRAGEISRDNIYHKRLVDKYGKENITVKLIADGVSEDVALLVEKRTIAELRAEGYMIANILDGGTCSIGAGRPRLPAEKKKVPVSIKLPRWLLAWMREQPGSMAVLIENAIVAAHNLDVPGKQTKE